jgi:hypothetical protein
MSQKSGIENRKLTRVPDLLDGLTTIDRINVVDNKNLNNKFYP